MPHFTTLEEARAFFIRDRFATENGATLFEYRLAPTRDFIQAILNEGHELEVVEPESLREIIRKELTDTMKRYK